MIDFNDENETDCIPESEEDRFISQTKLLAFNEMRIWIECVTNAKFLYPDDFRKSLADGILLCSLLNSLKPGSIKRINKVFTPMAGFDNIGNFLRVCKEDFGLSTLILFETSDLEDLSDKQSDMKGETDKRLQRVLICLFHLAKSVENTLSKIPLDTKLFGVLLQSKDHKEIKRLKSKSLSTDSSHDNHLSKVMYNQTAHYLATSANETLKKTKVNQEILHRSMDDEEWQERLENWKEKRRQVISNSCVDDNKEECIGDTQTLLELKESARKMKLLRDQIKDQSLNSLNQSSDQPAHGDNKIIPSIDDETKAMIERVKQKKFEEDSKRRFSISPLNSTSFASDSELSVSVGVEKHDEDHSLSEKLEIDDLPPPPENLEFNIYENNIEDDHLIFNDSSKIPKTRQFNIKLIRRSQQDFDQLFGMEIANGINGVIISRVKIGSCADICEVRKGDEILSINAEDVTKKSFEYIRSLLDQGSSLVNVCETVTLSLRRYIDEEEDDEFFSSDLSESNGKVEQNVVYDSSSRQPEGCVLEHEINELTTDLSYCEKYHYHNEAKEDIGQISTECAINICAVPSMTLATQSALERILHNTEDCTDSTANNLISVFPEINHGVSNDDNSNVDSEKQSVQDKVAKIESQRLINSSRLSSSWNVPLKSGNDPLFSRSTSCVDHSVEKLGWNSETFKYRQLGSSHSSLSNLYHYWETETPKSISCGPEKIAEINPALQAAVHSSICETEKSTNIEMEIAEQQLDTSNVNLEQTWRNVHSSGNSSTSDDVSALNETVIIPGESSLLRCEAIKDKVEERRSSMNPPIIPEKLNGNGSTSTVDNCTPSNISTGIQADLITGRRPTNYTTITTSVESKCNNFSSSALQMSDDETCSVTVSNIKDNRENCHSITESKDSYCQNLHSLAIPNKNEISKEYTTVTAVTQQNENPGKLGFNNSLSTEFSVTGVSEDNEKSVEIEVTVTPRLFPIRHKGLLSRKTDLKGSKPRSNDISVISDNSCTGGNTIQSEFMKITDLDNLVSRSSETANKIDVLPYDYESDRRYPIVKTRKKIMKNDSVELPVTKVIPYPSGSIYSNNKSHNNLHATSETDQSVSTVPVPTLFKSGPKSENTLSQEQFPTKSETLNSKKIESILSSKKIKKSYLSDNNSLTESKRSASTKELRFEDEESDKDWNFRRNGDNKPSLSFREEPKYIPINNSKNSIPQQFPRKANDSLPSTTNTKTHTKTYSIERSVKHGSVNKPQDQSSLSKPSNETKINMKCNYCTMFVGLEDLMVIEELNLHFHLRCFICSECKLPLGDGKSDTDVRIRRSKLHCTACYSKKSSKSKHRIGSTASRNSQTLVNVGQNKGGNGDGSDRPMHASNSNNCAASNIEPNLPSLRPPLATNNSALPFRPSLQLRVSYLDTF